MSTNDINKLPTKEAVLTRRKTAQMSRQLRSKDKSIRLLKFTKAAGAEQKQKAMQASLLRNSSNMMKKQRKSSNPRKNEERTTISLKRPTVYKKGPTTAKDIENEKMRAWVKNTCRKMEDNKQNLPESIQKKLSEISQRVKKERVTLKAPDNYKSIMNKRKQIPVKSGGETAPDQGATESIATQEEPLKVFFKPDPDLELESLTDSEFNEIILCPSPVWWEGDEDLMFINKLKTAIEEDTEMKYHLESVLTPKNNEADHSQKTKLKRKRETLENILVRIKSNTEVSSFNEPSTSEQSHDEHNKVTIDTSLVAAEVPEICQKDDLTPEGSVYFTDSMEDSEKFCGFNYVFSNSEEKSAQVDQNHDENVNKEDEIMKIDRIPDEFDENVNRKDENMRTCDEEGGKNRDTPGKANCEEDEAFSSDIVRQLLSNDSSESVNEIQEDLPKKADAAEEMDVDTPGENSLRKDNFSSGSESGEEFIGFPSESSMNNDDFPTDNCFEGESPVIIAETNISRSAGNSNPDKFPDVFELLSSRKDESVEVLNNTTENNDENQTQNVKQPSSEEKNKLPTQNFRISAFPTPPDITDIENHESSSAIDFVFADKSNDTLQQNMCHDSDSLLDNNNKNCSENVDLNHKTYSDEEDIRLVWSDEDSELENQNLISETLDSPLTTTSNKSTNNEVINADCSAPEKEKVIAGTSKARIISLTDQKNEVTNDQTITTIESTNSENNDCEAVSNVKVIADSPNTRRVKSAKKFKIPAYMQFYQKSTSQKGSQTWKEKVQEKFKSRRKRRDRQRSMFKSTRKKYESMESKQIPPLQLASEDQNDRETVDKLSVQQKPENLEIIGANFKKIIVVNDENNDYMDQKLVAEQISIDLTLEDFSEANKSIDTPFVQSSVLSTITEVSKPAKRYISAYRKIQSLNTKDIENKKNDNCFSSFNINSEADTDIPRPAFENMLNYSNEDVVENNMAMNDVVQDQKDKKALSKISPKRNTDKKDLNDAAKGSYSKPIEKSPLKENSNQSLKTASTQTDVLPAIPILRDDMLQGASLTKGPLNIKAIDGKVLDKKQCIQVAKNIVVIPNYLLKKAATDESCHNVNVLENKIQKEAIEKEKPDHSTKLVHREESANKSKQESRETVTPGNIKILSNRLIKAGNETLTPIDCAKNVGKDLLDKNSQNLTCTNSDSNVIIRKFFIKPPFGKKFTKQRTNDNNEQKRHKFGCNHINDRSAVNENINVNTSLAKINERNYGMVKDKSSTTIIADKNIGEKFLKTSVDEVSPMKTRVGHQPVHKIKDKPTKSPTEAVSKIENLQQQKFNIKPMLDEVKKDIRMDSGEVINKDIDKKFLKTKLDKVSTMVKLVTNLSNNQIKVIPTKHFLTKVVSKVGICEQLKSNVKQIPDNAEKNSKTYSDEINNKIVEEKFLKTEVDKVSTLKTPITVSPTYKTKNKSTKPSIKDFTKIENLEELKSIKKQKLDDADKNSKIDVKLLNAKVDKASSIETSLTDLPTHKIKENQMRPPTKNILKIDNSKPLKSNIKPKLNDVKKDSGIDSDDIMNKNIDEKFLKTKDDKAPAIVKCVTNIPFNKIKDKPDKPSTNVSTIDTHDTQLPIHKIQDNPTKSSTKVENSEQLTSNVTVQILHVAEKNIEIDANKIIYDEKFLKKQVDEVSPIETRYIQSAIHTIKENSTKPTKVVSKVENSEQLKSNLKQLPHVGAKNNKIDACKINDESFSKSKLDTVSTNETHAMCFPMYTKIYPDEIINKTTDEKFLKGKVDKLSITEPHASCLPIDKLKDKPTTKISNIEIIKQVKSNELANAEKISETDSEEINVVDVDIEDSKAAYVSNKNSKSAVDGYFEMPHRKNSSKRLDPKSEFEIVQDEPKPRCSVFKKPVGDSKDSRRFKRKSTEKLQRHSDKDNAASSNSRTKRRKNVVADKLSDKTDEKQIIEVSKASHTYRESKNNNLINKKDNDDAESVISDVTYMEELNDSLARKFFLNRRRQNLIEVFKMAKQSPSFAEKNDKTKSIRKKALRKRQEDTEPVEKIPYPKKIRRNKSESGLKCEKTTISSETDVSNVDKQSTISDKKKRNRSVPGLKCETSTIPCETDFVSVTNVDKNSTLPNKRKRNQSEPSLKCETNTISRETIINNEIKDISPIRVNFQNPKIRIRNIGEINNMYATNSAVLDNEVQAISPLKVVIQKLVESALLPRKRKASYTENYIEANTSWRMVKQCLGDQYKGELKVKIERVPLSEDMVNDIIGVVAD